MNTQNVLVALLTSCALTVAQAADLDRCRKVATRTAETSNGYPMAIMEMYFDNLKKEVCLVGIPNKELVRSVDPARQCQKLAHIKPFHTSLTLNNGKKAAVEDISVDAIIEAHRDANAHCEKFYDMQLS
jgi:hypothetical protein